MPNLKLSLDEKKDAKTVYWRLMTAIRTHKAYNPVKELRPETKKDAYELARIIRFEELDQVRNEDDLRILLNRTFELVDVRI